MSDCVLSVVCVSVRLLVLFGVCNVYLCVCMCSSVRDVICSVLCVGCGVCFLLSDVLKCVLRCMVVWGAGRKCCVLLRVRGVVGGRCVMVV